MLKITVAMTTYNGARYIKQQLTSVYHQIRRPDEVVIIDDGSTDRTVEIINSFIAENDLKSWRVVENRENLGFIRNFRKAVSFAEGDVVFLCDQDDVWYEDKIESISNLFATRPDILAVNSSFTVIDGENNDSDAAGPRGKNNYGLIGQRLYRPLEKISLKTVMHRNISPGCTAAFRHEITDAYTRNTDCTLPHDYEMNLLAAAKDGLYFYNMPLVKYRIHDRNTLGFAAKPQTRIEIAAEKYAAAKSIRELPQRERLYLLCAERLRALTARRLTGVLMLWRHSDYLRFYSFKERIGDLVYVFRKNGTGKEE